MKFRKNWALFAGLAMWVTAFSSPAAPAELVMLTQPGCTWCERWDAEIGVAYPRTWESRVAPLRRIDITRTWPEDLAYVRRDFYTPTFVLVDGGKEISRMRGYPGDNFFWPLLDQMLAELGHNAASADNILDGRESAHDAPRPTAKD